MTYPLNGLLIKLFCFSSDFDETHPVAKIHMTKNVRLKKLLFYIAVPPSIRPDPPDGNYVVKKGRKVELKCIASGNPDPTITWTRQVKSFVVFLQKKIGQS